MDVVFGRARTHEETGPDLRVGEAVADEPREVGLLGGEVVAGFGGTFAWALARGGQFTLGALRKPLETSPVNISTRLSRSQTC